MTKNKGNENNILQCGIVMPISETDGCSEKHWEEVLRILTSAIKDAGFEGNMVSNSDEVGIIHKTIIQNLYDNPIVVCDVSGKNPNVMFELGLRLAFDKPTIIVKDNKTSYTFDTGVIEHLEYPRDLRFSNIVAFKIKLAEKIKATYEKSQTKNYSTFLKNFGKFKVSELSEREITSQEFLMEELNSIKQLLQQLESPNRKISNRKYNLPLSQRRYLIQIENIEQFEYERVKKRLYQNSDIESLEYYESSDNTLNIKLVVKNIKLPLPLERQRLEKIIHKGEELISNMKISIVPFEEYPIW